MSAVHNVHVIEYIYIYIYIYSFNSSCLMSEHEYMLSSGHLMQKLPRAGAYFLAYINYKKKLWKETFSIKTCHWKEQDTRKLNYIFMYQITYQESQQLRDYVIIFRITTRDCVISSRITTRDCIIPQEQQTVFYFNICHIQILVRQKRWFSYPQVLQSMHLHMQETVHGISD